MSTWLAATVALLAQPSLDGLRERWAGAIKDLGVPGLAVAVVQGDEVLLLEGFGVRDPKAKAPVTPDTMFYIASCTKTFVAFLTVQLAEAGKLSLDDPVAKHLPRFQLADPDATASLKVADLLCHRPGLGSFPIVFLDAYTGEITDDRYYHFLGRTRPRGRPAYSNIHFTLVGRVVQALTGKSWRDALDERIFAPAGMKRTTGYASRLYGDADAAVPQEFRDGGFYPAAVRKTDETMHAAGGLGSSARDLARWLRLNLGNGALDGKRLLSEEGVARMQTLQVSAPERSPIPGVEEEGFGLGWQVWKLEGRRMLAHGGGYTGCAAHFSFLPEERLGVVALANTDAGPLTQLVALDVYRRLLGIEGEDPLPALVERRRKSGERTSTELPDPPRAKTLSLAPETYAGVYENDDWGTIRIEARGERLAGTLGGMRLDLKAGGTDRFRFTSAGNGDPRNGSFVVEDGAVRAVVLHWKDAGDARFVRR
jgi:CubicO group peptidase (beta-lactamase class C family)